MAPDQAAVRAALAARPEEPSLHNALANLLHAAGDHAGARACYARALELAPEQAPLHANLANLLAELGETEAAMAGYMRATALDPGFAAAWQNAGNLLRRLGRPLEAVDSYLRALRLSPADVALRYNLGVAHLDLGRAAEALTWFEQAVRGPQPHRGAYASAGEALLRLGRPEAALPWFELAVAADPLSTPARFGRGVARLSLGDYRRGWIDFEGRLGDARIAGLLPPLEGARWDGSQPVAGRTLLLRAEQGHGDTLQFVRYAPLLRARGARVVLQVQAGLVGLLAGLADTVLPLAAALPEFDLHCPLMSLPRAFGTELATVPAACPYLTPDPARAAHWRSRVATEPGPRVGIAWSGNPDHMLDRQRSIPAALLAPVLAQRHFHLLQTQLRPQDAATAAGLENHAAELHDFADTAALVAALDLVITVDTSVAHLAGALGRPVWILLPFSADFRWLRARSDSPWYPTARLFRQPAPGDWGPVIDQVAQALAAFCKDRTAWQHDDHARAGSD